MNEVRLIGNLTRDPEVKTGQSGKPFCLFSIACNERYKNQHGEWVDKTTFIDATAFGHQADQLGTLQKGTSILLTGKLEMNEWIDRQTQQKRKNLKVVVNTVHVCSWIRTGPRPNQNQNQSANRSRPQQPAQQPPQQQQDSSSVDETIPF